MPVPLPLLPLLLQDTLHALRRRFSTATTVAQLPEVVSSASFKDRLAAAIDTTAPAAADVATLQAAPTALVLRAAMATTHLHTQSRIAAFEGYGFYTIGPCGEELLAALALNLQPTDPMALHYRHLGALVARQLQRGGEIDAVLLDRARGYVTAASDPVTGGAHCSLFVDDTCPKTSTAAPGRRQSYCTRSTRQCPAWAV